MRALWRTFAADAKITKQETLWLAMCAGNELDTEHLGFAPAAVAAGSQQRRFMGEGFEGDFDIGPEDQRQQLLTDMRRRHEAREYFATVQSQQRMERALRSKS